MRVGVVGVGRMGWHMARRLGAAGHDVVGFDPRDEVMRSLPSIGVVAVASPAEVACRSDVAILMVMNTEQADEAVWGTAGYASAAGEQSILTIMSSLPPATVTALAERAAGRFRILDSPVSGGVEGAADGTLTIMVAGGDAAIDAVLPIYDVLGDRTYRVGGAPGLGATLKAINQSMYLSSLVSAAEMLVTAVKAGLDADTVVEVIAQSSGDSWALRHRLPLSWRNDYLSGGALALADKDIGIAAGIADALGIDAPVTRAAAAMVRAAFDRHAGEGDDPFVVETVEARAGIRLKG